MNTQRKVPKGAVITQDRGDNSENYTYGNKDKWGRPVTSKWYGFNPKTKKYEYKKLGGSTSKVEKPNMSTKTMKNGGPFSPEARAARKEKRTEKKITRQIKKSVMNSGSTVKSPKKGMVKVTIKGVLGSLKPRTKTERVMNKAQKAYKKSIEEEFGSKMKKGGSTKKK
jgi:hypothetical protein